MAIEFDSFVPKGKKEVVQVVKFDGKFRGKGPQTVYDILNQSEPDQKRMLDWASKIVGERSAQREAFAKIDAEAKAKKHAMRKA